MTTDNKPFMNTIERIPVEIVGGDGSYLIDNNGNRYLDFWGDEGVASLGYCTDIVQGVLHKYASTHTPHRLPDAYPSGIRTQAATALTEAARYDRAFFCNSGAEANEAMIKLARRYWSEVKGQPERYGILTLAGNFHGRTGYALAASDSSDSLYHKRGYGPTPAGFGVIADDLNINEVRVYDPSAGGSYLPAKDGSEEQAKLTDWSKIAAVTMAPILGNNTVKTYPKEFWERLEALRQAHGFLVLFDEVQVATGRTAYFCAHHNPNVTFGVCPDICAIGKGIAGGLPAAAICADDEIAQAFVPGVHFSTFGATIIVCEMMMEVIKWFMNNRSELVEREAQFKLGFEHLKKRGLITDYDGAGVHWGFTPNYEAGPHSFTGMDVVSMARRYNLLLLTHRPKAPIRFTPPLNINEADLMKGFSALGDTLRALIQGPAVNTTVG